MPDLKEEIKKLQENDNRTNQSDRSKAYRKLSKTKFAPVEAQIAFIKELTKSKTEADAFMKNPKQYAVDHGMLLSPDIVKKLTNQVLFDVGLDKTLTDQLGKYAHKDLIDMRYQNPFGVRAFPAAVVAVAAVVAAAAAVVTMVVTLVRASRPIDLVALQGLSEKGILLPGNIKFNARDTVIR